MWSKEIVALMTDHDAQPRAKSFKKSFSDFFTPPRRVALSFLGVILVGAGLLALPISAKGEPLAFLDALFEATSATCVTGLSPFIVSDTLTVFGQLVLLLMIQIGGLGFMTLMAIFMLKIRSRLSLHDKIAMREMLNWENIADMKRILRNIVRYTFTFELIGAILLGFVFIPIHGWASGMFKSVFIAISAFCNAGFDVIGPTSLFPYHSSILVNVVVTALIVVGGIGFAVWFDVRHTVLHIYKRIRNKSPSHKIGHLLNTNTKLVLSTTGILLGVSFLLILIFEFTNAGTIGYLNGGDKVMVSAFQAVTLRTAGFSTVDFSALRQSTKFLMMLLMFIGGSPGGTAGGIKTTTFATLILAATKGVKGSVDISIFKRTIGGDVVRRSLTILFTNLAALVLGIGLLCVTESAAFVDIVFEAVSALATVGLTLGLTPHLTIAGKIVIILLMYVGRVGMMTLLISVTHRKAENLKHKGISYPKGNIIVG